MDRFYREIFQKHLNNYNQMLFIGGARQVGKTTLSKTLLQQNPGIYLNWDNPDDRLLIVGNYTNIFKKLPSPTLDNPKPLIIFDEIHKYKDWKNHIKGFYDNYKDRVNIIVTGSSKLDVYKKGGDSLMGRYFPYTVHPLSLRELSDSTYSDKDLIQTQINIDDSLYTQLFESGGFPEPFLNNDSAFSAQWKRTRDLQLIREDIRTLNNVHDIDQLELLAITIKAQAGQMVNYTSLGNKIRVSDQTVRRWLSILKSTYYCFTLSPWSTNIPRSLLKEPKVYLWDWSEIKDEGQRYENFIASHLLKATSLWTERGFGEFGLYYLRDKERREVDFIVTKDKNPWFLVEAKLNKSKRISESLSRYYELIKPEYTFQVTHEMDYTDKSCFDFKEPIIVPSRTFLSQLL